MTTKAETEWMDAIVQVGCIVCYVLGYPGTPAVVHHLLTAGKRRRGHLYTIPLCDPGHHQNGDGMNKISRHPWKKRFEAMYGTEDELLAKVRAIVESRRQGKRADNAITK